MKVQNLRYKYLLISLFLIFGISSFANSNLKKVSVQLEWKHQFEFAGFYAAKEKGYYKNIGLDVKFKEYKTNVNITEDVLSGKSTFGISSSSLILEKLQKKPVVLLSSYFKQNALAIVTKPEIKEVSDLKGKRIMAVDWELEHTSIGAMLKDASISQDDIALVPHNFKIDKFVSGEVDAMSVFITSQPYELDKLGIKYNILNPANCGIYSYDVELFTSENMVKNDSLMVQNFIKATNKGWAYAFKHKQKIVDLIYNKYSKRKTKEALLYEAYKTEKLFKTNIFKIGAIAPELIKLNTQMYINLGLVKEDLDTANLLFDYIIEDKRDKTIFTKEELQYIDKKSTVKIAMMNNFKPFSFIEKNEHQGLSVDLLEKISIISGLSFNIQTLSWSQSLKKFKENTVDMISGISHTKKRESFTFFTKPFYEIPTYIFGNKNDKNYKGIEDLRDKRVGVSKDMFYINTLKNAGIIINEYTSSKEKAKALAFGNIDYFLANYTTGQNAVNSQALTNVYALDEFEDIKKEDLRYGINKNNKILYSIIEKSLNQIHNSEITYLTNKWIMNLTRDKNSQRDKKILRMSKSQKEYLKNKKEITFCADPNWFPLEQIKDGELNGISSDYQKVFEEKMGIPFKLIPTSSWTQSLEYAKQRKCDILSLLSMKTPQRQKYLNFTTPYVKIPLVLATKLNIPFVTDFRNLSSQKIGIPKNYAFIEILKNKYPNLNIIEVENIQDGLNQVKNGKLFGYIGTIASIGHMFQSTFTGELKIAGKFDEVWEFGMAVRDDDIKLLHILQKAVNTISTHKHQEILNKHVAIKYEKRIDYMLVWEIALIFLLIIVPTVYWNRRLSNVNKELIKTKKELEDSLRNFEYLFDNTIESVLLFHNNVCININEAAMTLFKFEDKSAAIGCNIFDFVTKESIPLVKNKLRTNNTELYEIDTVKQDGTIFPSLIKGYYKTMNGIQIRVTSLIDLTKLKEKENELINANAKALEAIKIKSNFLSNMSHEIRTPMNAVIGMIHLLQETGLNYKQEEYIQKIQSASNNLLKVINDILDFSKIEAGKLMLNKVDMNLKNILNEIENIVSVGIDEKNLQFNIVYDAKIPMNLYGDSLRLEQILINLISNAIKFTSEGKVELHIEQRFKDTFRFSVNDTGIGLSQQESNKLFNSFTQADDSVTRKFGGTGLGLAICKQLVDLMDGKIWIESQLDMGSKFIFEIVLQESKHVVKVDTVCEQVKITQKSDEVKKEISIDIINKLFDSLKDASSRRRPNLCEPIVKEIDSYKLEAKDQALFEEIKIYIKKYKFNEVSKLINER